MKLTRRRMLGLGAFTVGAASLGLPKMAFAAGATDKRLLYIFLKGGLDGLHAVPAYGDPDFANARAGLAMPGPGAENGIVKLNEMFGLHPALSFFSHSFSDKSLLVFHAVGTRYRARSHYEAQRVADNGTSVPFGREGGFLNAALPYIGKGGSPLGLAAGEHTPLALMGPQSISRWSSSSLPDADSDMLGRLRIFYQDQPALLDALNKGEAAQIDNDFTHRDKREQLAADGGLAPYRLRKVFQTTMRSAGRLLREDNGPRIAAVDLAGFDSHKDQLAPMSQVNQSLRTLNAGLFDFAAALGPDVWQKTAILIVTEFGRTVAMNSARGTDHGTASTAFLLGGSVNGGRVIADWPGLKPSNLFEQHDLYPTRDLRSIQMAVMRSHMDVPEEALTGQVFPDSKDVPRLDNLFKSAA